MITVRKGTFETNSSSTHAIVIPKEVKENDYSLYDSLEHNYYFGREESKLIEHWDEKLAYVYIVLKDHQIANIEEFKANVMEIYNELINDGYMSFHEPTPQQLFDYIDEGKVDGNITGNDGVIIISERYGNYVDHSYNVDEEFINRILNDRDFLKRFVFNRSSYITIGSDEYRGYNIKTIGFQYDYEEDFIDGEDDGEFWNKLKEYEKKNDVYLKGN